jgi:AraC family transcriptional regulator
MPFDVTPLSQAIFRGDALDLLDYECPGVDSGDHKETVDRHQLCFVRSGLFGIEVRGQRQIADANSVVLLRNGVPYGTDHPLPQHDVCTVVELDPAVYRALTGTPDDVSEAYDVPWTVRTVDRPSYSSLRALVAELFDGQHDLDRALTLEERALTLAGAMLTRPAPRDQHKRSATTHAHRALVEDVKEILSADLHAPLALGQISSQVAWSPFELTRLFKHHTGLPVHRYRRQLRLRTAYNRLTEGDERIVDIANDLGFASHSHFSEAFRNEFGETPSDVRGA